MLEDHSAGAASAASASENLRPAKVNAPMHVPERARIAMSMLVRAANAGAECPSNVALAEAMGKESMSSGSAAIALLETAGLIAVTRYSAGRVVTIVSTGHSTQAVSGRPVKYGRGRKRASAWPTDLVDSFADHIAGGASLAQAAAACGLGAKDAGSLFRQICAELGSQAQ